MKAQDIICIVLVCLLSIQTAIINKAINQTKQAISLAEDLKPIVLEHYIMGYKDAYYDTHDIMIKDTTLMSISQVDSLARATDNYDRIYTIINEE